MGYNPWGSSRTEPGGRERLLVKNTLQVHLQDLATHIEAHVAPGYNVRKLAWVQQARISVSRVQPADAGGRVLVVCARLSARSYEAREAVDVQRANLGTAPTSVHMH